MDLGLTGRTALVTGASSGLGLGSARALAAEGARVVMVSRSSERLAEAAATVEGDPVTIAADVSERDEVDRMVAAAREAVGEIDVLVANAGGPPPGTFETTPIDAYDDAIALNLMSTLTMCHATIPSMRARGWGRVVAITSISVRQPLGNLILSNTARAGLTAFLKTTATEVAADGVTVNSVQPGLHLTARLAGLGGDVDALAATIPTRTLGDPDDFGRIVTFLCSDAAKFITGAAIPVDGGAYPGLQ